MNLTPTLLLFSDDRKCGLGTGHAKFRRRISYKISMLDEEKEIERKDNHNPKMYYIHTCPQHSDNCNNTSVLMNSLGAENQLFQNSLHAATISLNSG